MSDNVRRRTDWAGVAVTLLMLIWLLAVPFVAQVGALLAATFSFELFRRADVSAPLVYLAAGLMQVGLLLVPLVPLAVFWRPGRYRALFRAWLAGVLFVLVLALTRLVPSPYPQVTLLAQSALAGAFCLALWLVARQGRIAGENTAAVGTGTLALAVLIGLVLALPWVEWGALGSVGDVFLGIVAALALGAAAWLILSRIWMPGAVEDSRGRGWDLILGGLVAGALLWVMASGVGFSGAALWLMFPLAACGWAMVALAGAPADAGRRANSVTPVTLVTLVAAAPLLLLDSETGILQLSSAPGESVTYATRAVALIVPVALACGLVLLLLGSRLQRGTRGRWLWVGAVASAAVVLGVYVRAGQPGLFGDRVFVILREQADVSAARNVRDSGARRALVYRTLTETAARTQAPLRAELDRLGAAYTPYYLVNALEVDADLPLQVWLRAQSEVDRVLPSPRLRPLPAPPAVDEGTASAPNAPQWNLTMIGADRVWKEFGVRGRGVIVGQSDSGVDGKHPELAEQYRGRNGGDDYNWLDPWNHTPSPTDGGGHGTHTLGSVLGKTVGVAPEAEWIGCVNLGRNLGNPARYLDCLQFLLAPYPQRGDALRDGDPARGAQILNNSWGCPDVEGCDPNALLPAARALADAGVFVVASAGNDGPACSTVRDPIALYAEVFSVGAVDESGRLTDFSSRGPVEVDESGRVKPDIVAPGERVLSALPGGSYGLNSGTSMAGPHIVGVVALMWSANPALIGDIETTARILRETARPANLAGLDIQCGDPSARPNDLTGYGIVDAYAAVNRARAGQ